MSEQINPEVVADAAIPVSVEKLTPSPEPLEPEIKTDENKNPTALESLPVPPPDTSIPFTEPLAGAPQNPLGALPGILGNPPPEPSPEPPKGRGRHPKGCKCGRCIQSGGSGGYEKGGSKPPGSQNGATSSGTENHGRPDFSDILGNTAQAAETDYGALANIFFDTGVGVTTMFFGPEWQPRSPEEKSMVTAPLAVYLKSKGMTDLPPGVILSIVILAYSAPRLQAPSTKQKLQGGWIWLKSKIFRKKFTPSVI